MTDISLVSTLKTAYELAHFLLQERDARVANKKVVELNTIIMAAQQSALAANAAQFALVDRVRELEKQIADMKAWEAEKEIYKLAKWKHGLVAYVPKDCVQGPEATHALCATCYDEGKKSILQSVRNLVAWVVKCGRCKMEITTTTS